MTRCQRAIVNKTIALLSAVIVTPLVLATADAVAATSAEPTTLSSVARADLPGPWLVRAESSLVGMRDNWLGMPGLEVGLTLGRDLGAGFSVELTGNAREANGAYGRSWSTMAALRGVVAATANGRHAFTVAGGPFVEVDNIVHGTVPFAHGELAYVYRAPFGLTVLGGGGLNMALASSPYVTPTTSSCDDTGDGNFFCIDLGPDAQEMHAGDTNLHLRLAVGWQF